MTRPRPGLARLAIVGAAGQMGRRLVALARQDTALAVAAEVDRDTAPLQAVDPSTLDAVVDFSVRAQVPPTAAYCAEHALPLVLGTTGLEGPHRAALEGAAERAAVVWAPNFSVGVSALLALAGEVARLLGAGWDLEVVEAHHRRKVDAPSGTARQLVAALAGARGWDVEDVTAPGRAGQVGARPAREIGVHAVRGGDVVGEHTVLCLGDGEQLTLGHRAQDRDIFVRGALRAARWLTVDGPRAPGLYGMRDVLGG